jgi:dTDP-4-amino-4,6-dideoxygalactose transaminase
VSRRRNIQASARLLKLTHYPAANCFIFYATKKRPIGQGAMTTTDDDNQATFARKIRLSEQHEAPATARRP